MPISKTFSAIGVSEQILVQPGDSFTYSVTSVGHVGTIALHSSLDGFASLVVVASWTGGVGTEITSQTGTIVNTASEALLYRFRSLVWTSTNVVAAATEATDVLRKATLRNGEIATQSGTQLFRVDVDGIGKVLRTNQKTITNAAGQAKAGTTSGFVVAVADNIALVTCPASKTGSTCVVPISNLKVGETITGFHLIGQIESGGNICTVDADLRKHTAAAADVTDASVGAITQLSVTADTIMSATNTRKASLSDTVGADETFYVLITVTTAAATDVALQGVAIETTEV